MLSMPGVVIYGDDGQMLRGTALRKALREELAKLEAGTGEERRPSSPPASGAKEPEGEPLDDELPIIVDDASDEKDDEKDDGELDEVLVDKQAEAYEDDDTQGSDEGRDRNFRYRSITQASPFKWRATAPRLAFDRNNTILIVVTMYNEEQDELSLTLRAISRNIKHMCKILKRSALWKSVAVCIVSDGRAKANPATMKFASSLGILSVSTMEQAPKNTAVHLFESVIRLVDDEAAGTLLPPLQVVFAMKEQNRGKLHSHLWFFEGFAHVMKPKFTFLLDVGTLPQDSAFLGFYRALDASTNIAGVCGRMKTRHHGIVDYLNPIVAAQHFEYEVASVLDKAFESSLGYLSVLPGAFSAYRYQALLGEPLKHYFKSIFMADSDLRPFSSNMTLAEDRLLCYELIAKTNCSYTLCYVNTAVAETDVPHDLPSLLKQRRRWLNGSFFALLYALGHFFSFWRQSNHGVVRKLAITFEFLFYVLSVVIQWLTIGIFFLVVVLTSFDLGAPLDLCIVAGAIFVVLVAIQFLMAFRNDPKRLSWAYTGVSFLLAVYFVAILVITITFSLDQIQNGNLLLIATLFVAWGIYLVAGLMHGALGSILISFVAFLGMMPTMMIAFPIFAMSNTHDVSWGTKDLDQVTGSEDVNTRAMIKRRFLGFRRNLICFWLLSNIALVILVFALGAQTVFLETCIVSILVLNGSRFIGSTLYLTNGMATSSMIVKFAVSPITPRAYLSVLKLPFTMVASAFYFAITLLMWMPASAESSCAGSILVDLSRNDQWLTHLFTSDLPDPTQSFGSEVEPEKEVEDVNLVKRIRTYFIGIRWVVPAIALVIVVPCVIGILAILAPLAFPSNCPTVCNLLPFSFETLRMWKWFMIPVLVYPILAVSWAADGILRWAHTEFCSTDMITV